MIITSKTIPYTGDATINLYAFGDIHLGSRHHNKAKFKADLKTIEDDPNGYWICLGDLADAIVPSDSKRFQADEIAPEYLPYLATIACKQRDDFIELIKPIADKGIGVIEGNHDFQLKHRHYLDITRDIAREANIEYLGNTALVRLKFARVDETGEQMRSTAVDIYATHGNGGGRKTGSPINRIEDASSSFDADIYLMGHCHQLAVTKKQRLGIPSKGKAKLVTRKQIFGLTGCYTDTYEEDASGYGERNDYRPTDIGMLRISIRPMTLEMQAEI